MTTDLPTYTGAKPILPIAVSENGTQFIQADGSPFFFLGDTAWPLLTSYSKDEAKAYISRRAEQGFTVIQTVFSWGVQTTQQSEGIPYEEINPAPNEFGEAAWTTGPGEPNDAYFDYAQDVLAHAESVGVSLLVIGMWGNYVVEQGIFTPEIAYSYGHYLGSRFRETKNLLWMNGGDRLPTGYEEIWNEYARGIREAGATQLMTYHPTGAFASSYFWHDASWLDFNFIQSWGSWTRVYSLVHADRTLVPHKPVILGEGAYEDGPEYPTGPITPNIVRRQAYWSYFAGGAHTYGQNLSWRMLPGWQDAVDSTGANQLHVLRELLEERDWSNLTPDQSVLYEGGGDGRHQRAALRSADRKHWTIYLPEPGMHSICIDRVAAAKVQATWVDPRNGVRIDGGVYETTNEQGIIFPHFEDPHAFKTPRYYVDPKNWEDSILLLDAIEE